MPKFLVLTVLSAGGTLVFVMAMLVACALERRMVLQAVQAMFGE